MLDRVFKEVRSALEVLQAKEETQFESTIGKIRPILESQCLAQSYSTCWMPLDTVQHSRHNLQVQWNGTELHNIMLLAWVAYLCSLSHRRRSFHFINTFRCESRHSDFQLSFLFSVFGL